MDIFDIMLTVLLFIWDLFKEWLFVFISPYKNFEILWIMIPIWLTWFFAEFFQEKKGTSLGNAISNGGVMIWVGLDWTRYLMRMVFAGTIKFGYLTAIKFFLAILTLGIGLFIVVEGIKTKRFVHFVGRIRQITYFLVMFSPIVYGIIEPTWKIILAMIIFAPLFYYFIELINYLLPNPKVYSEHETTAAKPEFMETRKTAVEFDLGKESSSLTSMEMPDFKKSSNFKF